MSANTPTPNGWRQWLRLPLASMPRLLLALLVLAWLAVLFGFQCVEGQGTWLAVMLTASLCIAGWVNHVRIGALQNRNGWVRWALAVIFDLGMLLLLLLALALPLAVITPAYSCSATGRVQVSMVLTGLQPLKQAITERAQKAGTLTGAGVGQELPPSARIAGGSVTADGQIFVMLDEPPAAFVLKPSMQGGEVAWTCEGRPIKVMPAFCRQPQ